MQSMQRTVAAVAAALALAATAQGNGIPVFMKESLRTLMGEDFRQEFPWEGQQCFT